MGMSRIRSKNKSIFFPSVLDPAVFYKRVLFFEYENTRSEMEKVRIIYEVLVLNHSIISHISVTELMLNSLLTFDLWSMTGVTLTPVA